MGLYSQNYFTQFYFFARRKFGVLQFTKIKKTILLRFCNNCYVNLQTGWHLRKLPFVCLGLTSLWNIWGHITTVPACSNGTLTNVLPHRNAMPQTQDTTPHPVTVYRQGANLSLCYPLMWYVTLEYTATHFNVLGETRPGNPSPTFHTHQRNAQLDAVTVVNSRKLSREYRTNWVLNPGPVVWESSTLSARPQRLRRKLPLFYVCAFTTLGMAL